MKLFFSKPRTFFKASLWGFLVALVSFLVMAFWYSIWGIFTPGEPHKLGAVAVGHGYSIDVEALPIHPYLAEYEQKLLVFGGDVRNGGRLGTVLLPTNTGGRVLMELLVPNNPSKAELLIIDRYGTTHIDLRTRVELRIGKKVDESYWQSLGLLSAESVPLKFISCLAWASIAAADKTAIVGDLPLMKRCGKS
jgi:hypothetical protein